MTTWRDLTSTPRLATELETSILDDAEAMVDAHAALTTGAHGLGDPTKIVYEGDPEILDPDSLQDGVETAPETASGSLTITMGSGTFRLARFTPQVDVTCDTFIAYQGSTALVPGTGIDIRAGAYILDSNGDGTLVARTANQSSWFQSATLTGVEMTGAMDTTGGYPASYTFLGGQRYALGVFLLMTGGTTPTVKGWIRALQTGGSRLNRPALRGASLTGQGSLPTSFTQAGVTETTQVVYMAAV